MDVEVVFPHVCGAFYQAYIQDLDTNNGRVLLSFPNDWKPSAWVDLGHVRFPPAAALPSQAPAAPLTPGTKVEALLPHHDNEPPGWWTGILLKSKGELHVVEFQSGSDKYQDIVDHDKIRLPNNNPPLSKVKFYRKEFDVSADLHEFCQRAKIHENFRAKIRAIMVQYVEEQRQLVVLADSESCLERASLLIEIHLKDLATHKALLTRNEMVAHRMSLQQQRQIEPGVYEIRFHVPKDLVGLAIGRDGNNVNEARRMDGIISVEYDDYSAMFIVKGETEEALSKAKERLEFCKDVMMIPRNLAGKVIGKKGNIIQEILDKSKVINVRVVGDDEAQTRKIDTTNEIPFDFIGRRAAIENAKMMMEYHLDHLKDVETILQSRKELDSQLAYTYGGDTYFPRPSDRGSRRGGRGGRGGHGRTRTSSSGRQDDEEEEFQHLEDPPPQLPQEQQETAQDEDVYNSDEDSDSSPDVQEADGSGDEKSPPEDDEQGPDRRRPQRPGGGRGGGGYHGPRRGGGRGGRGGGRGGRGYRNQRIGRGGGGGGGRGGGVGGRQQGQSAPETSEGPGDKGGAEGGGDGSSQPQSQSVQNGHQNEPSPKPQRPGRGARGGRGRGNGGRGQSSTQEPKAELSAPIEEGSA